jgi:hypothetical protein
LADDPKVKATCIFDTKETLQTLLANTATGRAELLQRHTILIQLLTLTITAFVAVAGFAVGYRAYAGGAAATVILVVGLLVVYRFIQADIRIASSYVKDL